VGSDPRQRLVDYYWRNLPQEALPSVAPIATRLRKAMAKVPEDEFGSFIDALEGTHRTPTGELSVGPYVKKLSKDTVAGF